MVVCLEPRNAGENIPRNVFELFSPSPPAPPLERAQKCHENRGFKDSHEPGHPPHPPSPNRSNMKSAEAGSKRGAQEDVFAVMFNLTLPVRPRSSEALKDGGSRRWEQAPGQ